MTDSTVYLVTFNDGDFYTRYPETLAAFASRQDALDYALCYQASEIETSGDVVLGLVVEERCGDEVVTALSVEPRVGVGRDQYGEIRITDRDAVYRDLGRVLSA